MTRSERVAVGLAFLLAPLGGAACGVPKEGAPTSEVGAKASRVQPEVRVNLVATGPAVLGDVLRVQVRIGNIGREELTLAYDPRTWIRGWSFVGMEARRGGELTGFSWPHAAVEGQEVCHDPDLVLKLRPNETAVRQAEVPLDDAPAGRVALRMTLQFFDLESGARCEKARFLNVIGETEITVRKPETPDASPRPREVR